MNWEYKFINDDALMKVSGIWNEKLMRGNEEGIRTLTALNNLGKQGWEYVEHGDQIHGHIGRNVYVFKREKK